MSTRKLYKVARLMAAMVIVTGAVGLMEASKANAEHVRSIMEKASKFGYARTTSVGNGASAEAVDFALPSGNHRTFSIMVENEDTTEANILLFSIVESGTVAASNLTSPGTDGSVGTVYRLRGGKSVSMDVQCVGIVWESEDAGNLVNANVSWIY